MGKTALISFIATGLSMLASVATSIIVATKLGPESRGIFAIIFVWATTLAAFSTLSIGDAAGVAVARENYTESLKVRILSNGLIEQAIVGLLLVCPGILLFWFGVSENGVEVSWLILQLSAFTIIAAVLNLAYVNYHRSNEQSIFFNLNRVAFPVIFAALLVFSCYLFPRPISLTFVLQLFVIAVIAGIAMNAFLARKLILSAIENVRTGDWSIHSNSFSKNIRAGMALHISTIFFFLTINIDKFVAARMLTLEDFGIYSVAASIAQPASLLAIITLKTLLVGDGAMHDNVERSRRLRHMALLIIITTVALSAFVWFSLRFIVPFVFGAEYFGVIAVAGWLLLGNVLTPLRNLLVEQARVRGKALMTAVIESVFLVVFCGAAYFFAPYVSSGLFGLAFFIANVAALASVLVIRNR